MSLLPEGASFAEQVQDYFLACRGSGLMLSALDAELVEEWQSREVPLEVIARGIRKAAEATLWDARPGDGLRSLRACKRQVEAEIQKHLGRTAGREQPEGSRVEPLPARRHKKLVAALRKLGREQPVLSAAIEALLVGALCRPAEDLEGAARQEELVYPHLLRALPFAERLSLLREARALSHNAPSVSWQAQTLARRFHRAAVVRKHLSLPSFW